MKRYLIGFALVSGILGMASAAFGQTPQGGFTSGTVEGKKDEQVPFYGFSLDFTASDGSGLNSVGENYRNDLVFYFEPSWNVGARFLKNTWAKTFQISARFVVSQELSGTDDSTFSGISNASPQGTCSNVSIGSNGVVDPGSVGYCNPAGNNRRTDYSDIWLTFRLPRAYTIPKLDIAINPALRLVLPASAQSRYQTLALGLTPSISLGRTFWKNRIKLGYGLGFTKNFHQREVAQLQAASSSDGNTTPQGGNAYDNIGPSVSNFYADPSRLSTVGTSNTNWSVTNTFSGGVTFNDKWSLDVLYLLINAFGYDLGCSYFVNGQTYDLCTAGDSVASASGSSLNRGTKGPVQVFWLTVAYQPLDWLGLSVAWINQAPTYKPDSSFRQGIISTDYNAFTTVSLGATVTVDKLLNRFRKN